MKFIKVLAEFAPTKSPTEKQLEVLIPITKVNAIVKTRHGYNLLLDEQYSQQMKMRIIQIKTNVDQLFQSSDSL